MRADTATRPAFVPRGVILSTAEMPPPVPASAVARALVLELGGGSISSAALTAAQQSAPLLAETMAVYVAWLAPRVDQLRTDLPRQFAAARSLQMERGHRRLPEALANLQVAAAVALQAFAAAGVLSLDEVDTLLAEIVDDLDRLGDQQDFVRTEMDPALAFLGILGERFASRSIYLEARHGGPPDGADSLGWIVPEYGGDGARHIPAPRALRVGWADAEWIYLLPNEAYRVASHFVRDTGSSFEPIEPALFKLLEEKGLIEVRKEGSKNRRTVPVTAGGAQRRVLKLRRDAIFAGDGHDRE